MGLDQLLYCTFKKNNIYPIAAQIYITLKETVSIILNLQMMQMMIPDSKRYPWNRYLINNVIISNGSNMFCSRNEQVTFVENSRLKLNVFEIINIININL